MSVAHPDPKEELAFIRKLTSPEASAAWRRGFGFIYALWGATFGLPLLLEWGRWAGYLALPPNFWLYASVTATVLIIGISVWVGRRSEPTVGLQSRALTATFAGIGWANVAVLGALIAVAVKLQDDRIMMLHGVVVFAFQGAAWYAVWVLQKRLWIGLVAAGWYVAAIALGVTFGTQDFILIAAVGLLLLMTLPGWLMMRRSPAARA